MMKTNETQKFYSCDKAKIALCQE